ncbi:hypothetical protein FGD67_06225 [Colwellia sp. M166]|uniref:hypothetical protein n=1 Tax=Colwellia sp. M166 TaxID=2583805 RepID=UPI00211ED08B|nr:hypothetical protein [Colwellia sp. M166]UUO22827.1 hypothetical protein FGD67_06225 [Colwellia sp. M166]
MSQTNARFIAKAYVNAKPVNIKNHWVVLQAKTPGTCQLTVQKSADQTFNQFGQVALDLGWGNMIDRVFFGYIERVMPSENGFVTLFCRELAAALSFNFNVMLRHPTLKQVLDELGKQSGLEFVVPEKAYAQTSIPCFYYDGSGYGLLDNIGRAYQIKDFIWQQQGNGKIFIGSYADSFWADKPIQIPLNLMTGHQAGNTATMAAAPMIRPNVLANNQRIEKIEFKATTMEITW